MSMRMVALVLAALLAVPAIIVVLRQPSTEGGDRGSAAHRRLEALWVVVPLALLAVLIAFSAAA